MVMTELLVSVPAFNFAVTSNGELSGVVSNAKSLAPIATTSSPLQDPEYLRLSLGSCGPFFIMSLLISSSVLPLTSVGFRRCASFFGNHFKGSPENTIQNEGVPLWCSYREPSAAPFNASRIKPPRPGVLAYKCVRLAAAMERLVFLRALHGGSIKMHYLAPKTECAACYFTPALTAISGSIFFNAAGHRSNDIF